MADKPLCFILMPFGVKADPGGRPDIHFDRVYKDAIEPAVIAAEMEPVRADQEKTSGIIHKAMFERLLFCEYAVADLTTANANVFYELGVRHTARPRTTQAIFAEHQPIPFDVQFLRAMPYDLGEDNRFGDAETTALRDALTQRLRELRQLTIDQAPIDSPIFQLLREWRPADLARLKTDVFRDRVKITKERQDRMASARTIGGQEGLRRLAELQLELGQLDTEEAAVVVDLMLSYRALKAWTAMIELHQAMPETLRRQILVREQLAFALNRRAGDKDRDPADREADRQQAIRVLEEVERDQGPSSETCGLLGRIYKDLWDRDRKEDPRRAAGHLTRAIQSYVRGFEADPRDAYPGINAVTLLEIKGDERSQTKRDELVPVVLFAVRQRLKGKEPDYWDHATMLELAVLGRDREAADEHLENALAAVREIWEPETTARNLKLIREAREARDEDTSWLDAIIDELDARAA